jgi:hypothetical protein
VYVLESNLNLHISIFKKPLKPMVKQWSKTL